MCFKNSWESLDAAPKNPSPRMTSGIALGVGDSWTRGWRSPAFSWGRTVKMGTSLVRVFSHCVQHMKTGCFRNIFPPSFDPTAVTEGFVYPGWSKQQHVLT